jgi:carboxyl-terminal processing protease
VSAEAGMTVYEGETVKMLRIATVQKESPAQKVGILKGDEIVAVKTDDGLVYVNDVTYSEATALIRGEAGSSVGLVVLREVSNQKIELEVSVLREELTLESVDYRVSEIDASVGILTISGFDLTTPTSLKKGMNALLERGIERFVIDLRDNGGGDLSSIVACASYFLNEDDVVLSTKDKNGKETVYTAEVRKRSGEYASCSVLREEIGMYRGYSYAILINGNTASAAELFTATFRDYELAPIVGETTYGKGTMQQTFPLFYFGVSGALKLTVAMYCPAGGENYDGIGISPNHPIEPSEALGTLATYEINVEKDNQLSYALDLLTK